MTELILSKNDILSIFKTECRLDGTLSHRGMARLADVHHTALIRGGDFSSKRLSQKLTEKGFDPGDISKNGWPIQAAIICLEYYAYKANQKTEQARALICSFGSVGMVAIHLEACGKIPASDNLLQDPTQKRLGELRQIKDLIDRMSNPSALILQKFEDRVRDLLEPSIQSTAIATTESTEWTIRDRLEYREIRGVSNLESQMGKIAAKKYREKYGKDPLKAKRVFNGKQRNCTVYQAADVELLDGAIDEYLAKKFPEAS